MMAPRRSAKRGLWAWWLAVTLAAVSAHTQGLRLVTDETGRRVGVPARVERIISLAPNITEILYALGLEARLVGVSNYCNYPPAAKSKPPVGEIISPSLEKIVALKPDLVLATPAGNRRETVIALERLGVAVYGIDPRDVAGVFASIENISELLGVSEAGAKLAAELRAELAAVTAQVEGQSRPRVLFVLWLEPLMSVGRYTFIHDVLRRAGAESVTAERAEDWPRLSLEEVIRRNPDYLVLAHSPALEQQLADLRQRPAWQGLRALQKDRVILLDEAVLRPGPRIVEAVARLARALHPEAFESR